MIQLWKVFDLGETRTHAFVPARALLAGLRGHTEWCSEILLKTSAN